MSSMRLRAVGGAVVAFLVWPPVLWLDGPALAAGRLAEGDPKPARNPKPAGDSKVRIILVGIVGKEREKVPGLLTVDPETGKWERVCDFKGFGLWPRVSPDGKTMVFTDQGLNGIWNCAAAGSDPARIAELGGRPLWSPDGKHLIVTTEKFTKKKGYEFETFRLNADGSKAKESEVPVPKGHTIRDWSADGKWLLTASLADPQELPSRLSIMRADGTGERHVLKDPPKGATAGEGRFSPDSRRLTFVVEKGNGVGCWVADVNGANPLKVFEEVPAKVAGICWSPDGKRLAVVVYNPPPDSGAAPASVADLAFRLVIVEVDGGKQREVKFDTANVVFLACPEWGLIRQ
jgi:Tol biopolymer transport system component